jgi:hypothetical protein
MKRLCWWLMLALAGQAEDVTLRGGAVLRDVTFAEADADTVTARHAGGSTRVFFYDLPAAVQARLGFDAGAALKRKTDEVERLKAELAAARGETVAARAETVVARSEVKAAQAGAGMAAAKAAAVEPVRTELFAALPPTPPAAQLPALQAGEAVSVFDLVNHYRADTAAADARYRKRPFQVRGVVRRVDDGMFSRRVEVWLESPDAALPVAVIWMVPDDYPSFFTKEGGQRLVGRFSNGGRQYERALLVAGKECTFAVRGGGLEHGRLELTRAELIR